MVGSLEVVREEEQQHECDPRERENEDQQEARHEGPPTPDFTRDFRFRSLAYASYVSPAPHSPNLPAEQAPPNETYRELEVFQDSSRFFLEIVKRFDKPLQHYCYASKQSLRLWVGDFEHILPCVRGHVVEHLLQFQRVIARIFLVICIRSVMLDSLLVRVNATGSGVDGFVHTVWLCQSRLAAQYRKIPMSNHQIATHLISHSLTGLRRFGSEQQRGH